MGIKTPKQKNRRTKLNRQIRDLVGRKPRSKVHSCGKVRYATETDAKFALALICGFHRGREKHPKDVQRCYHCPHCNGYHLTSWKYYRFQSFMEPKYSQANDQSHNNMRLQVFIERIDDEWKYTIRELYVHGTARSKAEAKVAIRAALDEVNPLIEPEISYFDDNEDIESRYIQLVSGVKKSVD